MEESKTASGNDLIVQLLWKMVCHFLNKHVPTILSIHSTSRYLPEKNKRVCSYKDLYTNVNNSFICNSQWLETTQMSIIGELSRWYILTIDYYSAKKGNELFVHETIQMNIK